MGRSRSTLILLVVALAFGGYLYFVDSRQPVADEAAKPKVFTSAAEKVNQLEIKTAAGEATTLRKDAAGTWAITSPTSAPADSTAVSSIVSSLANLEEERLVDENASDLKAFGLAAPRVDVTFQVEGEKTPKRLLIGDNTPAGQGVYAKLPEGNRVFLVSTSVDAANKSTFELRDKTALRFEQDKVTSLELSSSGETVRLEKTGTDWRLVKPVQAPADFVAVNGLLGQLQSAQMTALRDKPEDLKDVKQYGLDRPQMSATLGAGSSIVARLEIGSTAQGDALWARDPSKPAIFSVSNSLAGELKKTAADLRRKEVFDFRPFNTTRFEIARGTDVRAFERVKGTGEKAVDTWKQVLPSEKTVDSSNLEGALLDFSNLRAEGFVGQAGAATGHTNPAATITVKFDDGKREERVTIGTAGANSFATRADQPGALRLEAGRFEAAVKKLDAIQ
jgi:hypothetical protein